MSERALNLVPPVAIKFDTRAAHLKALARAKVFARRRMFVLTIFAGIVAGFILPLHPFINI